MTLDYVCLYIRNHKCNNQADGNEEPLNEKTKVYIGFNTLRISISIKG